jgi:hypothetical protein
MCIRLNNISSEQGQLTTMAVLGNLQGTDNYEPCTDSEQESGMRTERVEVRLYPASAG